MAILLSFARTLGLKGRLHVLGLLSRFSSVIVHDRKRQQAIESESEAESE